MKNNDLLENNNREKLTVDDLNELLEVALLENKYEFVNLLLKKEIDLVKFLTNNRLKRLYNYGTVFDLFLFNSDLSELNKFMLLLK